MPNCYMNYEVELRFVILNYFIKYRYIMYRYEANNFSNNIRG